MATKSVSDRLVERRGYLQQFCVLDPVKQHLPLVGYYRLARQLYGQMEVYVAEQAWDNAYVFLAKFVKLCSKVIPTHRDYKKPMYQKEREWISVQAQAALALFDVILDGMEDNERELMEEEQQEQERQHSAKARPKTPPPGPPPPPSAPPISPIKMSLEDRLAALRLRKAEDEAQKSASSNRSVEPMRLRASYGGTPTIRRAIPIAEPDTRLTKSSIAYPSVSKGHWMEENPRENGSARRLRRADSKKISQEALAQLSSGRLRNLEIPSNIISQFTAIAAPNTNRHPNGIETCGILAGKLHGTQLVITTLIIPKQEGSSDMCTMKNEEELFDYCFSHDLLTLGWIHTHPRQSCFLSSVDIHTQCGFQSILPEAVAIVVAPTDIRRNVGVFRLTEPDGIQLIQQCALTGFHTHPQNVQIYSDALACDWNPSVSPTVVDMRTPRRSSARFFSQV